ncbi:hypothetical protein B0H16DRAFT_1476501, partial [Mycena metata]
WAYAASASNNRVDKFLRWMCWEAVAMLHCTLISSRLHVVAQLINEALSVDARIVEIVRDAIETFWDFDNHLFFRISDWQLQRDVYLLGSGLRPPPVVIVDNIIFTSSRMAFTSTASPLAPSLLASMQALTASLQEALLLLQGLGEIGIPDRICRALNFNARCKALLRDDHGFATWKIICLKKWPASSTGSVMPSIQCVLLENPVDVRVIAVMPLDVDNYSIVHTAVLPNAKAAMSMNVDSIVSDDVESMVVDMPSVVDSVMASRSMDVASGSMDVASGSIDKGVQTDGQKPSDVNDTVVLPGVPLEALDLDDLCRMVRSLSSRVSYLQSLRDSNRSLTSLSAHEIPAELVAQCVEAIFSGHFDMLVAFCSTKHRLLTADMSPDVKEHMEHLFQQCHKCLSQMLGRLDEGRRLAPDVFLTASPPT